MLNKVFSAIMSYLASEEQRATAKPVLDSPKDYTIEIYLKPKGGADKPVVAFRIDNLVDGVGD